MQEQDAINQIKKNGYVLLNDVLDNKLCEMYKNMLNQDVEKYSKLAALPPFEIYQFWRIFKSKSNWKI